MIRRLIFLILLLASLPAHARMYQWTDPETGTTQLSGKPPAWYRGPESGPRVIVFEKGRVIDDTSINISDSSREELRRQALAKAVEDKEKARQMALQAEQLKLKMGAQLQEEPLEPAAGEEKIAMPDNARPAPAPEQSDVPDYKELNEDNLRALISEWEQQKTQQFKEKIGVDASSQE
jgi:hypothetical protein